MYKIVVSITQTRVRAARTSVLCGICCIPFIVSGAFNTGESANFRQELIESSTALQSIQEKVEQQVHEGQFTEANQQILHFFPEATRTRAQTLALGNMFYRMDAKLSYAMHKQVAQQLPHEPLVMLEWAMEQHRAGEYAGALNAYDEYSKAVPEFAPVHGLAADCLIRLGKTREASERWQQSEKATEGSLENLESMVCEVYRDPSLEQRRSNLCSKARERNVDAAVQLIWVDGKYERDWWNSGANRANLQYDISLLRKLPANPRIKAALCAADCLLKGDATAREIRAILDRDGYVVDRNKTLPSDATTLSLMLGSAIEADAMTAQQARQQFGEALRAKSRTSKDPDLFNVIAFLYVGEKETAEIEQQAWKATKDPRFASGYLVEQLKQKSLRPDDPVLAEALISSPEDCWILAAALAVNDAPRQDLLVQAIKAEYRHFSSAGGLMPRPSARRLQMYFTQLQRVLGNRAN
jgi:tetratricopeptide (TPR) repeat protein